MPALQMPAAREQTVRLPNLRAPSPTAAEPAATVPREPAPVITPTSGSPELDDMTRQLEEALKRPFGGVRPSTRVMSPPPAAPMPVTRARQTPEPAPKSAPEPAPEPVATRPETVGGLVAAATALGAMLPAMAKDVSEPVAPSGPAPEPAPQPALPAVDATPPMASPADIEAELLRALGMLPAPPDAGSGLGPSAPAPVDAAPLSPAADMAETERQPSGVAAVDTPPMETWPVETSPVEASPVEASPVETWPESTPDAVGMPKPDPFHESRPDAGSLLPPSDVNAASPGESEEAALAALERALLGDEPDAPAMDLPEAQDRAGAAGPAAPVADVSPARHESAGVPDLEALLADEDMPPPAQVPAPAPAPSPAPSDDPFSTSAIEAEFLRLLNRPLPPGKG
jgi:Meckel syndrome type 1 protein